MNKLLKELQTQHSARLRYILEQAEVTKGNIDNFLDQLQELDRALKDFNGTDDGKLTFDHIENCNGCPMCEGD